MGVVIVESGWGSLIPTVVIANMSQFGAAARSGKLNIGDQVMSINGISLVGLPLAQCQTMIKVRGPGTTSICLKPFFQRLNKRSDKQTFGKVVDFS